MPPPITGPISGTPLAFVYVADRERALRFYTETLGFPLHSADGHGDLIDLGAGRLRTTVIPGHKAHEHPVVGWAVDDLVATVQALRARGVVFAIYEGMGQDELGVWTSDDGQRKLAFFNDPDDNVICLSQG